MPAGLATGDASSSRTTRLPELTGRVRPRVDAAPPGPPTAVVAAPMVGSDERRSACCACSTGRRARSRPGTSRSSGRSRAVRRWRSRTVDSSSGSTRSRRATEFLLDRLPDVIWAAGADRVFTYVSAGSEQLLGYRPEELVGRSSDIVMHESSREAFAEGYRWQVAHPDGDQTYRVNLRHRDGHAVPVELHNIGTPVNGRYGGGTGSVREMTERDRLEREIRAQAAELAANRERAHLAQELHDSVTQALFSMTITAGAARMLLERDAPGVDAKLDELSGLARDAMAEMRSLIFELRPGSLAEEGFVPSLEKHLAAVQGRTGLVIRLDVDPDLRRLPLSVEDALYRIAQEAIHNVVRHANAREVGSGSRARRPGSAWRSAMTAPGSIRDRRATASGWPGWPHVRSALEDRPPWGRRRGVGRSSRCCFRTARSTTRNSDPRMIAGRHTRRTPRQVSKADGDAGWATSAWLTRILTIVGGSCDRALRGVVVGGDWRVRHALGGLLTAGGRVRSWRRRRQRPRCCRHHPRVSRCCRDRSRPARLRRGSADRMRAVAVPGVVVVAVGAASGLARSSSRPAPTRFCRSSNPRDALRRGRCGGATPGRPRHPGPVPARRLTWPAAP